MDSSDLCNSVLKGRQESSQCTIALQKSGNFRFKPVFRVKIHHDPSLLLSVKAGDFHIRKQSDNDCVEIPHIYWNVYGEVTC